MMMMPNQARPHDHWSKVVSLMLRLLAIVLAILASSLLDPSNDCNAPGIFTYTHFGAFVFFIGCGITTSILEAVALYLQVHLESVSAANRMVIEMDQEEEQRTAGTVATIVLLVLDLLVPFLLFSATAAAYVTSQVNKVYRDNIRICAEFSSQVEMAEMLSLAACIATVIACALFHRLN